MATLTALEEEEAAAASSSSGCRYDVFLSFRGEDTRKTFTSHLYAALKQAGIDTFLDDEGIERGENLKPELEKAIKESRTSIIVLSENYASSTWCLDELVLILDRRSTSGHAVLPVFYDVDPSHVRNHQKSFCIDEKIEAQTDVEKKRKWMENSDRWKAALTEVANLTGMVAYGLESKFIQEIVQKIVHKVNGNLRSTRKNLIGIQSQTQHIDAWLQDNSSYGVDICSIWGMGGIGKTTAARHVYDLNSHRFEGSSFLADIGREAKESRGLIKLQEELLQKTRGGMPQKVYNVHEGTVMIEKCLKTKKVIVVLDGIDEVEQINDLLGSQGFQSGSKIIITTRDKSLPIKCEVLKIDALSRRYQQHTLKELDDNQSLELLSWHAFGCKDLEECYKGVSRKIVKYCEGNPLALRVLGCSLFGGKIEAWEKHLDLLKKGNDKTIQNVLQTSFDCLKFDEDKDLFLHIACFFVGKDKDYVETILEGCGLVTSRIEELIERSLLTIGPNNKLMMHQLVQDMGREIVRLESPKEPGKRTRLWCHEDSFNVLKKKKGTNTIEGLVLDMKMLKEKKSVTFKTDAFRMMDNLKLLQINSVQLTGSYEEFPEDLAWLCWHEFPSNYIPFELPMENLVALDMSFSKLENIWESPKMVESLKILDLSDCQNLVRPDFSGFESLETLILRRCTSLDEVCETIGKLKKLTLLDMTGCKKLKKLPRNIGTLKSLQNLIIADCSNLTELPVELKDMESLKKLNASDFNARTPQLFLFSLPKSLVHLTLNNRKLCNDSLPVDFDSLSVLQHLNLGNNPFESLPNCIRNLNMLRVLDVTNCRRLKSIRHLPSSLEELYADFCESLEKISFDSGFFSLREIGYNCCPKLVEIQGLLSLKSDGEDSNGTHLLNAHQNHVVCLIGDDISQGKSLGIQMLYEFGIHSTFRPGIKEPNMKYHDCPYLFFVVEPYSRLSGVLKMVTVSCVYRISSEEENRNSWPLFIKIINVSKGLVWVYNPIVFGKPRVGEDIVWTSYWPMGNQLEDGDEISLLVVVGDGMEVTQCGISMLEYFDQESQLGKEVHFDEQEEKETLRWKEIIGGDLSRFQLREGLQVYYLCHRDFFWSAWQDGRTTPRWFKMLFGENLTYTLVQGWSKLGRPDRNGIYLRKPYNLIIVGDSSASKASMTMWRSPADTSILQLEGLQRKLKLSGPDKFNIGSNTSCNEQGSFMLEHATEFDENIINMLGLDKTDLTENVEVCLIGDEITQGRNNKIQILYEFGIFSTFVPRTSVARMVPNMWSNRSSTSFSVTYHGPPHETNVRPHGITFMIVYRLSSNHEHERGSPCPLFIMVTHVTKRCIWIYNPIIFGTPKAGEDLVWSSYWLIGDQLDKDDKLEVFVVVGKDFEVKEWGIDMLVCDEQQNRETQQNNMDYLSWKDIIGGDLSAFELRQDLYYLCRRDFLESEEEDDETTPEWLRNLFHGRFQTTDIKGWTKLGRPHWMGADLSYELQRDLMVLDLQ